MPYELFFIAAIVTVLSGVSIPEKTILMYQALGIIALLFGQTVDLSLTAVLATGLITLLCCQFDVRSFLLPDLLNQHFGFAILVLTALCAGFQVALAKEKKQNGLRLESKRQTRSQNRRLLFQRNDDCSLDFAAPAQRWNAVGIFLAAFRNQRRAFYVIFDAAFWLRQT